MFKTKQDGRFEFLLNNFQKGYAPCQAFETERWWIETYFPEIIVKSRLNKSVFKEIWPRNRCGFWLSTLVLACSLRASSLSFHKTMAAKGLSWVPHVNSRFLIKGVSILRSLARDRAILDATAPGGWYEGQPWLLSLQTASRDRAGTELSRFTGQWSSLTGENIRVKRHQKTYWIWKNECKSLAQV